VRTQTEGAVFPEEGLVEVADHRARAAGKAERVPPRPPVGRWVRLLQSSMKPVLPVSSPGIGSPWLGGLPQEPGIPERARADEPVRSTVGFEIALAVTAHKCLTLPASQRRPGSAASAGWTRPADLTARADPVGFSRIVTNQR
jgi:hypothetical protein